MGIPRAGGARGHDDPVEELHTLVLREPLPHRSCAGTVRTSETPNVLAPDDRDHLEELVLCGVDEPLVALEECVEVVLDLGRQRSYRGRRQREVGGQLPWRPGQAPGDHPALAPGRVYGHAL